MKIKRLLARQKLAGAPKDEETRKANGDALNKAKQMVSRGDQKRRVI